MHGVNKPQTDRAQVSRLRNSPTCTICGEVFAAKRSGRKRHFCSNRCRDEARRNRNYRDFGNVLGRRARLPRNSKNSPAVSEDYNRDFAGRASAIHGPRNVIEAEIDAALTWTETVSRDGVVSQTAKLREPVLVERTALTVVAP